MQHSQDRIADAAPGNWVDRYAPSWFRPYARLARYDRPIGYWLLFWPCAWGSALALAETGGSSLNWLHLAAFLAGAIAMRGAGCTYNDIIDRDLDARVARTRLRPLASGAVSVRKAAIWLGLQCAVGLAVLLQFNTFTVVIGIAALIPVALYPFMKRITWWPQLFLGISFGWGALVGYAAIAATLSAATVGLYLACMLWIIGYDTIYAHQDREEDALIGVRSTARRFEANARLFIGATYAGALALLVGALAIAGSGWPAYAGALALGLFFALQVARLDTADPARCLAQFKHNGWAGALPFIGLGASILL